MADLTDAELRLELIKYGYTPGPIVPSTRKVLEKKLQKLKSGKLNSKGLITVSTDENDSDAAAKSTPKSNRRKKSPIKSSSTKQASVASPNLGDEEDLDTNSVGLQCSFNEGLERPVITGRRPLGANSPFTRPKFYSSTPKYAAQSSNSSYSTYRKFSSVTLRTGDNTKTVVKRGERKSSTDDSSSWRPQNISALIILVFGAFISVIVYLYLNQRLLGMERAHVQAICNKESHKSLVCSSPEKVKPTQQVTKAIYDVLNTREGK